MNVLAIGSTSEVSLLIWIFILQNVSALHQDSVPNQLIVLIMILPWIHHMVYSSSPKFIELYASSSLTFILWFTNRVTRKAVILQCPFLIQQKIVISYPFLSFNWASRAWKGDSTKLLSHVKPLSTIKSHTHVFQPIRIWSLNIPVGIIL